jgi:hypothetical protein
MAVPVCAVMAEAKRNALLIGRKRKEKTTPFGVNVMRS